MQTFLWIIIYFMMLLDPIENYVNAENWTSPCPEAKCDDFSSTGTTPTCRCDEKCASYNDCCLDSPFKNASNNTSSFSCSQISNSGYFISSKCQIGRYKKKCLSSQNYTEQVGKVRLKVPVTSLSRGITFGNIFCAQCNNVTDIQFWNVSVTCETVNEILTIPDNIQKPFFSDRSDLNSNLTFDIRSHIWKIKVANRTENCTLLPRLPPSLENTTRRCKPNVIKTCQSNWTLTNITDKCLDYQSIVSDINKNVYRNAYCAMCNGIRSKDLRCRITRSIIYRTRPLHPPVVRVPLTIPPLSSISNITDSVNPTNEQNNSKSKNKKSFVYLEMELDCHTALKYINFTKINTETIYYKSFNRTFITDKLFVSGNSVEICKIQQSDYQNIGFSNWFCDLLINLCIIVSIGFLLLHLREFFSPNASNNIYQKNLASYSFALLLGNIGLLLIYFSTSDMLTAISLFLTYFGVLASFFWLTSMAFDITSAAWTVGNDSQKLSKRFEDPAVFSIYSKICWTLPAILTILHICSNPNESQELFSNFLTQNIRTWLLFFVLPLVVTMSVNLAFYICSAYVMCTDPEVVDNLMQRREIEFRFHTGLVVTSNLMWPIALVGGYTDNYFLFLLFAVLDVVLALLVYVSSPVQNEISKKVETLLKSYTVVFNTKER